MLMEMMKALVKKLPEKGLWLEDVVKPVVQEGEVLIKMHKTAICGTDVHIYNWDEWSQATIPVPMTVGHEFVGEIVEIGPGVKDLKVGDIVSGEGHIVCGKCRNCLAGKRHLCKDTQGVGVNRTGIFAEYATIPAANVWLCDTSIPAKYKYIIDNKNRFIFELFVYIECPISTFFHSDKDTFILILMNAFDYAAFM